MVLVKTRQFAMCAVAMVGAALLAPTALAAPSLTSQGKQPSEHGQARLVDIRTGLHPGYDRVVFEFDGGLPKHRVAYEQVREPGSGHPVELIGRPLHVVLQGMELGSYQGPDTLTPLLPEVAQVKHVGSFEGVDQAAIGVTADFDVPVRVFTLTDPERLVIDVPHTVDCGAVAFAPNTDHGAFDIAATGAGCGVARDVAALADTNFGEPYSSPSGFHCHPRAAEGQLTAYHYTCTRGLARVTFNAS